MLQTRDKSYKKPCTEVRNIEFISKNRVNSLSLLFCHSSSNSVSIAVYTLLLNGAFPFQPFAYFLASGYLLPTSDNANSFRFPLKVPVIGSLLYILSFLSNEAKNHFEK